MKLNTGKRILMFFHWLLSLLICAAFAIYMLTPDLWKRLYDGMAGCVGANRLPIIGIALLAVYVVLAVIQVYIIFQRTGREDRGFITVDSSDTGRVRIAVSAIEQMVRQSVTNIDGISDMKIVIENMDDAIGINIAASIINGCHVPTITMNMQRSIRQFVEMNCGVAVRTVPITINAVTPAEGQKRKWGKRQEAAPFVAAPVPAAPAYKAPEESAPASEPTAAEAAAPVEPAPKAEPTASEPADKWPVYQPEEEEKPEEPIVDPFDENDEDFGLNRPIKLTLDHSPSNDSYAVSDAVTEAAEPDEKAINDAISSEYASMESDEAPEMIDADK